MSFFINARDDMKLFRTIKSQRQRTRDESVPVPEKNRLISVTPENASTGVHYANTTIRNKEWIPIWLRLSRAIPLATYCCVFVLALQILDEQVRRHHGLPDHVNTTNAVMYLPTLGVVFLGFAWKAVVSDVKKIIPWSTLSGKWRKGSHSIELDYISSLEIASIWPALRRRHWPVSLALIIGFLCGALVALANSLAFVNLFATASTEAAFVKTSTFDFNGTLVAANGSLTLPFNNTGSRPYAAAVAETLENSVSGPWTYNGFSVESISHGPASGRNVTLEANLRCIYTQFKCDLIKYKSDGSPIMEWLMSAKCAQLPVQAAYNASPRLNITAWLNTTSCSGDTNDVRLAANIASVKHGKDGRSVPTLTPDLTLLCAPAVYERSAQARINATNNKIAALVLDDSARPQYIDPQLTPSALYMYLNNPVDGRSQIAFEASNGNSPHNFIPYADQDLIQKAANNFIAYYNLDPFFSFVTDGQAESKISSFLTDAYQFQAQVESAGARILRQVINELARKDISEHVDGRIWTTGSRIFLRNQSLRALQATLLFIGLVAILLATLLRPKTILQEDPGPIASTAIILSSSDIRTEEVLSHKPHTGHRPEYLIWRLRANHNNTIQLESEPIDDTEEIQTGSVHLTSSQHYGYGPTALWIWSKVFVALVLILVIIVLAGLLAFSKSREGLCRATKLAADAFSFVPTIVLVLLGYALSGVDGALRSMMPFKSLQRGSKKRLLLFNLHSTPSIYMPFLAVIRGLGAMIVASSFVIILIPAMKIIAANLYGLTLVSKDIAIHPSVDTTLIESLDSPYNITDPDSSIQRVSQFAEWAMVPSFDVPQRPGIVENLVISSLTKLNVDPTQVGLSASAGKFIDLPGAEVRLNVPAIAVDVECKSTEMGVKAAFSPSYTSYKSKTPDDGNWRFSFACASAGCNETLHANGNPKCPPKTISPYDSGYQSYSLPIVAGHSSYRNTSHGSASNRFIGTSYLHCGNEYQVYLADLENIQTVVSNSTVLDPQGWITSDIFNVSLPTIRTAVCTSNFSRVTVDVTFTQQPHSFDEGLANHPRSIHSWNPIRVNRSSITYTHQYPTSAIPSWLIPLAKQKWGGSVSHYDDSTDKPGNLDSESLYPTRGSSSSIFELLATHAENELHNLTALLDPDAFTAAVRAVHTAYSTEMLVELRPFVLMNASAASRAPKMMPATLSYFETRIVQDTGSTIALEVLLVVVGVCVGWVFVRFPNEKILPRCPESIAGRAELLAGSRLVSELRRNGVGKVKDSNVWGERRAALGWWPRRNADAGADQGG